MTAMFVIGAVGIVGLVAGVAIWLDSRINQLEDRLCDTRKMIYDARAGRPIPSDDGINNW